MAKNYTYGWRLKELGYTEVPESEYTERQKEDKEFIDMLSNVVWKAGCEICFLFSGHCPGRLPAVRLRREGRAESLSRVRRAGELAAVFQCRI